MNKKTQYTKLGKALCILTFPISVLQENIISEQWTFYTSVPNSDGYTFYSSVLTGTGVFFLYVH